MTPAEITTVAVFRVPGSAKPYRVGLATPDNLVAITTEAPSFAVALRWARHVSAMAGLPITVRLKRPRSGGLH